MKNKSLIRIATLLLTLSILCSIFPYVAAAPNSDWADWTYAAAWTRNDDDSLSYAGTDTGAAYQIIHKAPVNTNCVDVDLRIDGSANAGNGGAGLFFTATNGDTYYFTYNVQGYAAIIKNSGGVETYLNSTSAYPSVPQGEWTNFKIILEDSYIAFYIGGKLIFKEAGSFTGVWDGGTIAINDYAMPLSVRVNSLEPMQPEEWTYTGWVKNEDVFSYDGSDLGAAHQVVYNKTVTTNCVDVDLRIDGAAAADNGHIGVWLTAANGDAYYFMYSPVYHYASVIRYPAGGGEEYLNKGSANPVLETGTWANFKVLLEADYIAFYIDGALMHQISGDFAGVFDNAVPKINDYAIPLSARVNSLEPVQPEEWSYSGWTKNEDGFTYNGSNLGAAHQIVYNKTVTTNCVDVDLRIDGAAAADNGHIGLWLTAADGDAYYFMYSPVYHYASVIRYPSEGGEEYLNKGNANPVLETGKWTNFKVLLEKDYIAFYIDGALMHLIYGEFAGVFDNAVPRINDYAVPASARINSMENVDIDDLGNKGFPEAWGYNSNWSWNEDEKALYYNGTEFLPRVSYNYPVNTDCIEFSAKVTSDVTAADANLTFAFVCPDGDTYLFQYGTYAGYGGECCWITHMPQGTDGPFTWITPQVNRPLKNGEWHDFKIILKNNVLALYADGALVCYHYQNFNGKLANGLCYLQSYNCAIAVKDVKLSSEEKTIFDYDFEFDSDESVAMFTAENGTIRHEGSSLLLDVESENAALQSPPILEARGHRYSALLELRNTVFLRVKNDTAATALKVTVTTDNGSASVEVPVAAHSDPVSLYANFSKTTLSGYIRSVRIEPLGASEGTLSIDSISFEREAPLVDFAGEILSCTADFSEKTVTVTGRLNAAYRGKTVTLYETEMRNIANDIEGDVLATVTPDGADFTLTFPLMNGNMTRLSSMFLAAVGDVRLDDRFAIENGAELEKNPYPVTIPERSVTVTDAPYNAKGDAFTDDTAAIQAAIDDMTAQGGGTVIIPGELENFYGKRYIITNVQVKSNVELRIEEGAVLWQSPRYEDYTYAAAYGHNAELWPPITWCAAAFCTNYPMISAYEAENIRITGKGTIRGCDYGNESFDGCTGEDRDIGCASLVHLFSVGLYACKNVELSGLSLTRVGGYFCPAVSCERVTYSDLRMSLPACVEADMIDLVNSKDIFINRCFGYSNDDSVVLSCHVEDPRGQVSPWWKSDGTADNDVRDVTVKHSSFVGGKGLTFIAWGTNRDDLSQQEIKNITAEDCHFNTSACWYDNPYYGTPYFTSLEEDYSSVSQIRIFNCQFDRTPNLRPVKVTDLVTDFELHSTNQFVYGDFERNDADHPDWITGLSNWTVTSHGGSVTEVDSEDGRCAKLAGRAELAQGLYMKAREKVFTATVKLESGAAKLFVKDILTGELVAEKAVEAGGFTEYALEFTGTDRNLYLGIEALTDDTVVYFDNAAVTHIDGDDEGDPGYPRKEEFLIDQKKALVTAENNPDAVFTRNEIEGKAQLYYLQVFRDEWEFSYTVRPTAAENRLRSTLSNSDHGKQILIDFWYHNDNQLMISLQYKTGKKTWTTAENEWIDLPEGSRVYGVKLTHAHADDYATLTIYDKDGTPVYTKQLRNDRYTCDLFYGTGGIYGLNYDFFDWSPNGKLYGFYYGAIGGNKNPVIALQTFRVTWDVDGETTTEAYKEGEMPSFKGSTDKAPDGEYTYSFTGWTPEVTAVTCDITYTAQYSKTPIPPKQYTVTFFDGLTGETIAAVKVEEGKSATAPEAPKHEGYTFKGWDKAFDNVTENLTVTALYEKNKVEYTVTFVDGLTKETIAAVKVEEGKSATAPEAPKHEGYTFKGWDKAFANVTENLTVTAIYEKNVEPEKPWVNPFKDVKTSDWFYEGVKFANQQELFNGTAHDTFSPNDAMTRAMLVTVLWRLDGKTTPTKTSGFVDVPSKAYYTEAVAWAAENGIVNGTDATHFAPNDEVTREQIAAILFRYAEKKGVDTTKRADLNAFPDANKVSAYAKDALAWANAEGLVRGSNENGKDYLAPAASATRAQVATILARYAQNIVK